MKPKTIKHNDKFAIDEVVKLINMTVIRNNLDDKFKPENLGIIVGVLTLNDEVEMVVKFIDRITQFTKSEFSRNYKVLH
jgi:hypothetical protein